MNFARGAGETQSRTECKLDKITGETSYKRLVVWIGSRALTEIFSHVTCYAFFFWRNVRVVENPSDYMSCIDTVASVSGVFINLSLKHINRRRQLHSFFLEGEIQIAVILVMIF